MKLRSGTKLKYEDVIDKDNNSNNKGNKLKRLFLNAIYFVMQFISMFIINTIIITTILFVFDKLNGIQ